MREISDRRRAVSSLLMTATAVVIIVAGSGSYLYYSSTTVQTSSSSSSSSASSLTIASSLVLAGSTSAGFYKGSIVSFDYTQSFACKPPLSGPVSPSTNQTEATAAANKTACEVGTGKNDAESGAVPVFILVPAFAGLSIFGVPLLGATSQGYPTFNNTLVFTQCAAGGSPSACSDHPALIYSPYFTAVEQHIGIFKGYGGLPEGVLPTPSHSHVVDYVGGPSIPWYVVTVLVFDPNVMPDGQTGQCHQWVNSNLTSPTANCLTSFTALGNAMTTKTTATASANNTQDDPIYDTFGGVGTQVLILGVSVVSESSPTNTNLFLFFCVNSANPFGGESTCP